MISDTTSSSSVNTPHQEPWFLVRYSDGDEEEVDWHTLHHILLAPDHLSEQPAVSMSTREQVTGQGGAAGGIDKPEGGSSISHSFGCSISQREGTL